MNGDVRVKMLSSLNPKLYIEYGIIWNQAQRARYDMATAIESPQHLAILESS